MFKRLTNKRFLVFVSGVIISTIIGVLVSNSSGVIINGAMKTIEILKNESIFLRASLIFTFFVAFLISYVNKDIGGPKKSSKDTEGGDKLKSEISDLKNQLSKLSSTRANALNNVTLTPEEKEELIKSAKKRIVGNAILAANLSLKSDINTLKTQLDINKHYSDIVDRLENEIDRLNRRGGVNLALGAGIAFAGIIYLGVNLPNQPITGDKFEYILHMAPKLSFVIVIELFAYFFLKLYKNGFDQVKYFQNELTNIDSKVLGIKFLKDIRNEELMGEVIKSLMATERNFILEKGQSTVPLEQERISKEGDKNLAELLKEIIKLKK